MHTLTINHQDEQNCRAVKHSAIRQSHHIKSNHVQLPRNHIPGGTYFFTVNLHDRTFNLLITHIDAWVFLPDLLLCIGTLPAHDDDYSSRWLANKKAYSKSLPKIEYGSKIRIRRNERGIWQRRFWEHMIRGDHDYDTHMDYMHYNPVKHG